ncbi:MAG: hypothetical protein K8L97_26340 [Anaerolineae bacterium]|nr:hypothetical protein [Anaerolineae bacterium]
MVTSESASSDAQSPDNPRPVSRGLKLQLAFLGIDSLYLILEYPHLDVYTRWASIIRDEGNPRLHEGVPFEDFLLRRGGLGYKFSIWDGDARLFITDRVTDRLKDTASAGQGMGVMLQLGPKWLCQYGDVISPQKLTEHVLAQLIVFGVSNPEKYPIRINRMDITADVLGLPVASFSIDEWRNQWVGYAVQKHFHISARTGQLEGLSIGSSEGAVRFKVYDKVAESIGRGTSGFWRSVWGVGEQDEIAVARFEWTIKCYAGRYAGIRYLSQLTFEGFLQLLNYASLHWGRLCIPQAEDSNPSRWPLHPIWEALRELIDDWTFNYKGRAKRDYDFRPDLNEDYLKSVNGWLGGFMARVGIERGLDTPAGLATALQLLESEGHSLNKKAVEKWELLSKMVGGGEQDE